MHCELLHKLLAIAFAAIIDQIAEFVSNERESLNSITLIRCHFA